MEPQKEEPKKKSRFRHVLFYVVLLFCTIPFINVFVAQENNEPKNETVYTMKEKKPTISVDEYMEWFYPNVDEALTLSLFPMVESEEFWINDITSKFNDLYLEAKEMNHPNDSELAKLHAEYVFTLSLIDVYNREFDTIYFSWMSEKEKEEEIGEIHEDRFRLYNDLFLLYVEMRSMGEEKR